MEESIIIEKDREQATKMQSKNYERFKALVRMHLSFELDLNTDEFDLPCHEIKYYEKGKMKKWNRFSKKLKGCAPTNKKSSPLEGPALVLTAKFIKQLQQLKDFLLKDENIIEEGIFRITGSRSRQNELKSLINQQKPLNLDQGYTVHDCATVYKGFLSELPEPLMTENHYPAHCQIADLCNEGNSTSSTNREFHLLRSIQLLLLLLPNENRTLLEDIIEMLHKAAKHEKQNKMTPDSLATIFTPHLICSKDLPPEALLYVSQTMSSVISYMISKGSVVFDIPPKLGTDIRAYLLEQKRKKTMSPEQILDESISDISTVNTVYTFVDREKTAAAHNSNPTDTALAQLYAHIQTLPESSKKRKLIKQFNKENGHGTPLQLLQFNRVKNPGSNRSAKSIGDSIKRHIFSKSIISRTPKRTISSPAFDTPNAGPSNPKMRVLFQSPITPSSASSSSSSSCDISSSVNSHPLQKSISSSSLLTVTHVKIDIPPPSSLSAPVSRTSSGSIESSTVTTNIDKITPYKILCETVTKITDSSNYTTKKTVAFLNDSKNSININIDDDNHNNNDDDDNKSPSTPIMMHNCSDLKSRYKSEPNLSRVLSDKNGQDSTTTTTPLNGRGKSFTNKLIKGVSMGNLKFSFTPETKIRTLKKSASLLVRRNPSLNSSTQTDIDSPYKENNDDDKFGSIYRLADQTPKNISTKDILTSTPSFLLGRKSMSPITKSTQRMPKSMQESIMTPRSRKPVMLAATIGNLEGNQSNYQNEFLSFREEDEDSLLNEDARVTGSLGHKSRSENDFLQIYEDGDITNFKGINKTNSSSAPESLTNTFREYLLSRSVVTTSPVDSSFSSQPDDFGSTPHIRDLDESELSASLLYCLNGNQPDSAGLPTTPSFNSANSSCDNNMLKSTSSRKRSYEYSNDIHNTEQNYSGDGNSPKRILLISENPNETSL